MVCVRPLSDWPNNKCYPILGVVVVWQSRLFRAFFWIAAFQVVAWNESRRGHFVFRFHGQDALLRILYFWNWICTQWCGCIDLVPKPSVSMGDFTGGVNHAGLLNSHRWQVGMFLGITGSGWLSRQPPRLNTAQKSRAKKMPVRTLSKVCIFLSSMHPFLGVFN